MPPLSKPAGCCLLWSHHTGFVSVNAKLENWTHHASLSNRRVLDKAGSILTLGIHLWFG